MNMKNITLIGMPGSGKSTVGVLLAKTVGMGFIDTDLLIQTSSKRLLYKMIEEDGKDAFIKAEEEAISKLFCANCVIATGGSAVYGEAAMEHLREISRIVYISVPLRVVKKRLRNIRTRGVVMDKGESIESLYAQRVPLYEKYADVTVGGESTPEETVEKIIEALNGR